MNLTVNYFYTIIIIISITNSSAREYDKEYETGEVFIDEEETDETEIKSTETNQVDRTMMTPFELLFSTSKAADDSYLLTLDDLTKSDNIFQTFVLWLKHNVIHDKQDKNQLIMEMLRNRIYLRHALEKYDRKLFLKLMQLSTQQLKNDNQFDWQDIWDQWIRFDRKNCIRSTDNSDDDSESSFHSFISDFVINNPKDPLGILKN